MSETMSAAVLDQPFSITVRQIPRPLPGTDEALVRVHCIGICGSDVHYYEFGRIGRYIVENPIILGHELAGEIVEVGGNVKNVAVGDRVAVEPGVTCGRCDYCKSGRYNLCPDVQFMATPPHHGAWAEYVAVRSDFLYKLPDTMSYEQGALLEPLSVGMYAMARGRVKPSDRILVQGLGPIGLLAIQAARMYGVSEIYASDGVPLRRELAKELGAKLILDPFAGDVQEQLMRYTDEGIDVIVETSGNARAIAGTVKLAKRGGRIVLIGLPIQNEIPFDIAGLIDAELDVLGIFRYANTYPSTIRMLGGGCRPIEKIITHKFSLERIQEAVELARTKKDKSVKTMIYPNGGREK